VSAAVAGAVQLPLDLVRHDLEPGELGVDGAQRAPDLDGALLDGQRLEAHAQAVEQGRQRPVGGGEAGAELLPGARRRRWPPRALQTRAERPPAAEREHRQQIPRRRQVAVSLEGESAGLDETAGDHLGFVAGEQDVGVVAPGVEPGPDAPAGEDGVRVVVRDERGMFIAA
jgi:hypothetical protein